MRGCTAVQGTASEKKSGVEGGQALQGRTCVERQCPPACQQTNVGICRQHLPACYAEMGAARRRAAPWGLAGLLCSINRWPGSAPCAGSNGKRMKVLSMRAKCMGWGLVQRPCPLVGCRTPLSTMTACTRISPARNMHCKHECALETSCCAHRRRARRLSPCWVRHPTQHDACKQRTQQGI